MIDRFGGRLVMSAGSVLAAALLVLLSRAHSLLTFYAAWAGLGIAAAMLLYEAAFAVIYKSFITNARNAVTALTLCAGFASTIFWPLTQALVSSSRWRQTVFLMALMNLLVCLPLHLWLLPNKSSN